VVGLWVAVGVGEGSRVLFDDDGFNEVDGIEDGSIDGIRDGGGEG